jgi:hypothetical protein
MGGVSIWKAPAIKRGHLQTQSTRARLAFCFCFLLRFDAGCEKYKAIMAGFGINGVKKTYFSEQKLRRQTSARQSARR